MNAILIPVLVLAVMSIVFAVILSFASQVFHVKVDRRIEAVRAELPGANCGGCGFPGCDGLAAAIILKDAPITSCPVGGQPLWDALAELLGKTAESVGKQVAVVHCQGNNTYSKDKYVYGGIADCRVNAAIQGGSKKCSYGCLGEGTCKSVCAFDAIDIIDGLAVIDKDKCTACQKCISVCPRNLIELRPYDQNVLVKCKSKDTGKVVRANCSVGCIGCKICEKQYPEGFKVQENLAQAIWRDDLNPELLQKAVDKCPTKAIYPGLLQKAAQEKKSEKAS